MQGFASDDLTVENLRLYHEKQPEVLAHLADNKRNDCLIRAEDNLAAKDGYTYTYQSLDHTRQIDGKHIGALLQIPSSEAPTGYQEPAETAINKGRVIVAFDLTDRNNILIRSGIEGQKMKQGLRKPPTYACA